MSMNDIERVTLYNTIQNSKTILSDSLDDDDFINYCFCLNEKWCFNHIGINAFKEYDNNVINCCTCLDCCTWCLEFNIRGCAICYKPLHLYLCCFTIYFT